MSQNEQGHDLIKYTLLMSFAARVRCSVYSALAAASRTFWSIPNTELATANVSTS
jgi:hypothetical protein